MFEATSTKTLVVVSVLIQILCIIFGLAASGGSDWSQSVCMNLNTTSVVYDTFTFGLTQYKAIDVDNTQVVALVVKYNTDLPNTRLQLNLDALRAGGTWTSTMLAFAVIVLVFSLLGHLCIHPFQIAPLLQNYAYLAQLTAGFFFVFACVFWDTLSSTATRHVMVDVIPNCDFPQTRFGWCYNLCVTCALFTLTNAICLSRPIHKKIASGNEHVTFDNNQNFTSSVAEGISGDQTGATYGTGKIVHTEDQQDMNYGNADL